jgi:hypothetical protein
MRTNLALSLVLFSVVCFAQKAPLEVTGPSIPDSVAYRLVFLSLSLPDSVSPLDVLALNQRLSNWGLGDVDKTEVIQAATDFKAAYQGLTPSGTDFQSARAGLVSATLIRLQQRLTSLNTKCL